MKMCYNIDHYLLHGWIKILPQRNSQVIFILLRTYVCTFQTANAQDTVKQETSTQTMNSTKVQNPQRKLDVFSSVLVCAKSDHVFQKLSYSLCRLCLSLRHFVTIFYNPLSDRRLFNVSLRSQAPQQQYTVLFLSSMQRHGHRHGHSHKLTYSRALQYYTAGIPFSDA